MTKPEELLKLVKTELKNHNVYTDVNLFVSVAALETLISYPNPEANYNSLQKDWKESVLHMIPELMDAETWTGVNQLFFSHFYGHYKLEDFAVATRIAAGKLRRKDLVNKEVILNELVQLENKVGVYLQ